MIDAPPWITAYHAKLVAGLPAGRSLLEHLFLAVRDGIALDVNAVDSPTTIGRAEDALLFGSGTAAQKSCVFIALARHSGVGARFACADLEDSSRGSVVLRRHVFASIASGISWFRCDVSLSHEHAARLGTHAPMLSLREDRLLPRVADDGRKLFRYRRFHGDTDDPPIELLRTQP